MSPNTGLWTAGLEGTADRLNAALLQYDTYANIPAAGQTGRMFLATDTGMLYRDNGASWDVISMAGPVGVNNTEATSNSTSADDRITVSGLSIPVTSVVLIVANVRATRTTNGGAANFGLKVNATVVYEAATGLGIGVVAGDTSSGLLVFLLGSQVANYGRAGMGLLAAVRHSDNVEVVDHVGLITAAMPAATITSVTIRGISNHADVTHGIDELRVFRLG